MNLRWIKSYHKQISLKSLKKKIRPNVQINDRKNNWVNRFQICFWNLLSFSGSSQICKISNAWRLLCPFSRNTLNPSSKKIFWSFKISFWKENYPINPKFSALHCVRVFLENGRIWKQDLKPKKPRSTYTSIFEKYLVVSFWSHTIRGKNLKTDLDSADFSVNLHRTKVTTHMHQ
jgi:hypothetical protein